MQYQNLTKFKLPSFKCKTFLLKHSLLYSFIIYAKFSEKYLMRLKIFLLCGRVVGMFSNTSKTE